MKRNCFFVILLLGLVLSGCGKDSDADTRREYAAGRCQEIIAHYRDIYLAAEKPLFTNQILCYTILW